MVKNELCLKRDLKFGVEIEMITRRRRETIVEALREAGLKVNTPVNNIHRVFKNSWKVVHDASVDRGLEVVSPPLKDFRELKIVLDVLKNLGCDVDVKCGLHVHHDIADLDKNQIENVYEIYNKYEEHIIDKYLPMSRRVGSYNRERWCKPVKDVLKDVRKCKTIEDMENHMNIGGGRESGYYNNCRYRSINFRSYLRYKTLEFRHHSGTLEFDKIRYWVLLTHIMIDVSMEKKKIKPVSEARMRLWKIEPRHSSYDFYKELGINGTELSDYLGKRRKSLKNI